MSAALSTAGENNLKLFEKQKEERSINLEYDRARQDRLHQEAQVLEMMKETRQAESERYKDDMELYKMELEDFMLRRRDGVDKAELGPPPKRPKRKTEAELLAEAKALQRDLQG